MTESKVKAEYTKYLHELSYQKNLNYTKIQNLINYAKKLQFLEIQ